jgi:hypothetical protein
MLKGFSKFYFMREMKMGATTDNIPKRMRKHWICFGARIYLVSHGVATKAAADLSSHLYAGIRRRQDVDQNLTDWGSLSHQLGVILDIESRVSHVFQSVMTSPTV